MSLPIWGGRRWFSCGQKQAKKQRKIGSTVVSSIGYGAMGIAGYYGPTLADEERFKVYQYSQIS